MRPVKFKKWLSSKFDDKHTHKGLFHRWGINYEEFENSTGNYTVAIVELEDGSIEEVLPRNLKFDDK